MPSSIYKGSEVPRFTVDVDIDETFGRTNPVTSINEVKDIDEDCGISMTDLVSNKSIKGKVRRFKGARSPKRSRPSDSKNAQEVKEISQDDTIPIKYKTTTTYKPVVTQSYRRNLNMN
jgi:hypothetical protein